MSRHRPMVGFTLIEMLVALSVTVIAIAGATTVITQAHQQLSLTGQLQQAHYRAASHLAALQTQPLIAGHQHGVYQGVSDDKAGRLPSMRWELELMPVQASDLGSEISLLRPQVQAFQAELAVFLPASTRQIRLSAVVFSASSIQEVPNDEAMPESAPVPNLVHP